MGLVVTTDSKKVKVIRKDGTSSAGNAYTLYSVMYRYKKGEEWKNAFIDCSFPKGADIANKAVIEIKDSYMTANEYNGKVTPKLFIKDYAVVEDGEQKPSGDGFMNIPDGIEDELPFQ